MRILPVSIFNQNYRSIVPNSNATPVNPALQCKDSVAFGAARSIGYTLSVIPAKDGSKTEIYSSLNKKPYRINEYSPQGLLKTQIDIQPNRTKSVEYFDNISKISKVTEIIKSKGILKEINITEFSENDNSYKETIEKYENEKYPNSVTSIETFLYDNDKKLYKYIMKMIYPSNEDNDYWTELEVDYQNDGKTKKESKTSNNRYGKMYTTTRKYNEEGNVKAEISTSQNLWSMLEYDAMDNIIPCSFDYNYTTSI